MVVQLRLTQDGSWILPVIVTPKSGKNLVVPLEKTDTAIQLKVTAPADKGAANEAVIALLAGVLHVPKSKNSDFERTNSAS